MRYLRPIDLWDVARGFTALNKENPYEILTSQDRRRRAAGDAPENRKLRRSRPLGPGGRENAPFPGPTAGGPWSLSE